MLINNKKKKIKKISKFYKFYKFYKYFFFTTLLFISASLFIVFNSGYTKFYTTKALNKLYINSYINYLKIPQIFSYSVSGLFVKIPEINLNIDYKNKIRLEKDREEVLNIGKGHSYNFKTVNAEIKFENETYKTTIRLKGDRTAHFEDINKSSYKVKLKNDKTILGINKFSLMKPRMRNYIHEWIYHELMKEGNLISLKYEFVKLKINGVNKGLYVVEEGFDKILIERNKRRNGPIFSLKEEWNMGLAVNNKPLIFEVYNKKNWYSKNNIKLASNAITSLDKIFNKDDELDGLFDEDKWSWFLAASDINFYAHGMHLKSVKFYYNTLSSKFEPIGFDGHRIVPDYNKNIISWPKNGDYRNSVPSFQNALNCREVKKNNKICEDLLPYKLFFNNNGELKKKFFNKYKKNIDKLSSDKFLKPFFQKRKEKIFTITSKIYGDYFYSDNIRFWGPGLYFFNKESFYERSKTLRFRLRSILENVQINQDKNLINITNWNDENNIFFTNRNILIKKLFCNKKFEDEEVIFEINQSLSKTYTSINILEIDNLKCTRITIFDEIFKTEYIKEIEILNPKKKSEANFNLGNYLDYFNINDNYLELKRDETIINENIKIPGGYIVKIKPEQKIILSNNSIIISESAFNVDGGNPSTYRPIEIKGKNTDMGGGLFLLNTKRKNFFNNVIFKNLNGSINDMFLEKFVIYGAINFYNSSLTLKNFVISDITSEDAINIVSSNFALENGVLKNIAFDAIDSDYSSGVINNIILENISNDGLDFSESSSEIFNVKLKNIGDKAISAGENSKLEIENINIFKSFVGIASKDGSSVSVSNIENQYVLIPYASFKKKNEYENPSLKINNTSSKNYQTLYYKDEYSTIIFDDVYQNEITKNINKKIYSRNGSIK